MDELNQVEDPEVDSFGEELDRRIAAEERRRGETRSATEQSRPRRRPVQDPTGPSNRRRPKPKNTDPQYTIIDFLRDDRFHYAVGIFICFVAIVTAVCGFSFIYSTQADQSLTLNKTIAEVAEAASEAGVAIENAGGAFGAKLGQWLMVDSFGIASFVFAVYLFLIGLAVMKVKRISFWTLTFRCLFTMAAGSVVLGFFTYNRADYFDLGGNHGRYANELLLYYSDWLGAFGVSLLLIALLIATYFKPIKWFCVKMFSMLNRPRTPEPDEDEPEANRTNEAQEALDAMRHPAEEQSETVGEPDIPLDESDNSTPGSNEFEIEPDGHLLEEAQADDAVEENDDARAMLQTIMQPATETVIPAAGAGTLELVITNTTTGEGVEEARDVDAEDESTEHTQALEATIFDPRTLHSHYKKPPIEILIDRPRGVATDEAEQKANTDMIVTALRSYGVEIQSISATIGPTVTRYEMVPAEGVRIAKIRSLEDDIAMSLAALGIRIIAPIPGKSSIGIEVPNRKPQVVSMRTVLESNVFRNNKMHLPMALGCTITNEVFMADLAKMPHLLVAGATGQGKSVGLNAILTTLLYSKHPDELKLVLIDPKMVEFSLYESIAPHFMARIADQPKSVITDPQIALQTLASLCEEMEQRYGLLTDAKVRVIEDYNAKFVDRKLNPEQGHRYLPYIVVIVDEFADLVTNAGKEIYTYISRIVAKARAVGIHMILATQRPSTDVITGVIKSNFPARIAFKVTQGVDSKTILDRPGAQRLIGRGDMLTLIGGTIERVQCAFVDTPEVEEICDFISRQDGFYGPYELPEPPAEGDGGAGGPVDSSKITEEFKKCAVFTASQQTISITLLQRQFEIGFGKAARYVDQMEKLGIVGPANGAKPRQVHMTPDEVTRMLS